jgi:hypothetical protein
MFDVPVATPSTRCAFCFGGSFHGFEPIQEPLWKSKCSEQCVVITHPSCWAGGLSALHLCPNASAGCGGHVISIQRVVQPSPLQQVKASFHPLELPSGSPCLFVPITFVPITKKKPRFFDEEMQIAASPSDVHFQQRSCSPQSVISHHLVPEEEEDWEEPMQIGHCDHSAPQSLCLDSAWNDRPPRIVIASEELEIAAPSPDHLFGSPQSVLNSEFFPRTLEVKTQKISTHRSIAASPIVQFRPMPPIKQSYLSLESSIDDSVESRSPSVIAIIGRIPLGPSFLKKERKVRTQIMEAMTKHGLVEFVSPIRASRCTTRGNVLVFFADPTSVIRATNSGHELKLASSAACVTVQKRIDHEIIDHYGSGRLWNTVDVAKMHDLDKRAIDCVRDQPSSAMAAAALEE